MTRKPDFTTNEHVVEIRYRPNPRILDYRGRLAEQISAEMAIMHWRIVENRVDVFATDRTEHVFVGFRNAGYTSSDTPTKDLFPDKASKLFRFLFSLDSFDNDLFVERLGIRSRFCTPFSGTFEKLVFCASDLRSPELRDFPHGNRRADGCSGASQVRVGTVVALGTVMRAHHHADRGSEGSSRERIKRRGAAR